MKAQFAQTEPGHLQQEHTVSEARDVGFAVSALLIAHGDIPDFQVEQRGAEKQVEIAEWIEVPESLDALQ